MEGSPSVAAPGIVLRHAAAYDFLLGVLTLGREQRLRTRALDLAQIVSGESVLDVGCGTGTLAIAASRRVGRAGRVCAIDASPEMIQRAIRKAARTAVAIDFRKAPVQSLPYTDHDFDVVLSTLMLHHLPPTVRSAAASEMARVLRPGGRALAVDFGETPERRKGIVAHFHRHGRIRIAEMVSMFQKAGFAIEKSGAVGLADLSFVLARVPQVQKDAQ